MKKLLLLSLTFFLLQAYSQEVISNARLGYYYKNDTTLVNGVYIHDFNYVERSQKLVISGQANHESAVFYPGDVMAYGFSEGKLYRSFKFTDGDIEKHVFVEELVNIGDSIIVFYYAEPSENIFFLASQEGIRKLNNKHPNVLWKKFSQVYNCFDVEDHQLPDKLTYNGVTQVHYAIKHCNKSTLQKVKFGVVGNFGSGKPYKNEDVLPAYKYNASSFSYSVGAFVQIPIDIFLNFRPEVHFSYIKNESGHSIPIYAEEEIEGGFKYERQSLQIPLMFQFTINQVKGKIVPYVEAGPIFDIALKGGHTLSQYQASHNNYDYNKKVLVTKDIVPFHLGASLGTGLEYKFNQRNSVYAGFRFNYTTGVKNGERESLRYLFFNVAFTF